MAIDSGGGGGGSGSGSGVKKQRVDEHDRCEAVGSDAIRADRISALPDELQLHILTRLPLKDAIRTGALARGWRNLWKRRWGHRASLKVRLCSRDDPRRELDALARESRPRRRLERFSLIVSTSYLKSSEFQRFLDYATECGVEDLHVETRTAEAKLKFLPLSCPALARLSLHRITVSMFYYKRTLRSFHALEVIRLVSVSIRPEAFREMMARCPSLRTLDLRRCSCDGWEFGRPPPNLRSLTIADCDGITSLDFVRVSTLRSFRYCGRFSNLPLSIPRNAALSDLYIQLDDSVSMKGWNTDTLRKYLPNYLSSLNILTICYEALTLLDYRYTPMEGSVDQVCEEPPEDGLDNLVMVKVNKFNWNPTEVQLVSFLLRKASSLCKPLIVSRNVTPMDSPGTPEADLSLIKEALVNGKIMLIKSGSAATQPYHEAFIKLF